MLFTLVLLQLLAFIAFPVNGLYGGYMDTPIYIDVMSNDGLLYDLRIDSPYIYNMIFAVWSSAWGGLCSLFSFGLSFLLRKHKTVALVIPTLVSLALFQLSPLVSSSVYQLLHFSYCYPNIDRQLNDPLFFVVYPAVITALSLLVASTPLFKGKDVLL